VDHAGQAAPFSINSRTFSTNPVWLSSVLCHCAIWCNTMPSTNPPMSMPMRMLPRWLEGFGVLPSYRNPFWGKDALTRFLGRTDFVRPRAYRIDVPETIVMLTSA
jgi:hypothetical protein